MGTFDDIYPTKSIFTSNPNIGYFVNQCKKIGLWEPFEKNDAKISVTIKGRKIYFKSSIDYKLFRQLYSYLKKAGIDTDWLIDSMDNVIKIKENKSINMKRVIKLTESDLRGIIKGSVNRLLREYMFDNPLNRTDLDGSEFEDEEGLTPEVGTDEYDPDIDDLGMNGPDDNIEGFKSPFYGLRDYMYDDKDFLDNATYDPDFNYFDDDDITINDGDYENYIQRSNESKINLKRVIRESINKVLSGRRIDEGSIGLETVPEDVARRYGFKPEYKMGNGTEIWGRYLNQHELKFSNTLLFKLGIKSWAGYNIKGHVKIYVKPEYTKPEPGSWRGKGRRKIGDYVDTEWMDKGGAIFRNPKNGHVKRFNIQDF